MQKRNSQKLGKGKNAGLRKRDRMIFRNFSQRFKRMASSNDGDLKPTLFFQHRDQQGLKIIRDL